MLEFFNYNFFVYALVAVALISVSAAMIGTYIISRRLVAIDRAAVTHACFGGLLGLGYYLGVSPVLMAGVFAVASSVDSRIILDETGAEKLVGRGDMLYLPLGAGKPTRVQGCLITDEEVASVVEFVKKSGTAQYDETVLHEIDKHVAEKEKGAKGVGGSAPEDASNEFDELLPSAIEVVVETGMASVSMLQRRLSWAVRPAAAGGSDGGEGGSWSL